MAFKQANGSVIETRKVDESTVDVFTGTGWLNWSRFTIKRIKGKVFLNKVNGKPLKADEFKDVCQELS